MKTKLTHGDTAFNNTLNLPEGMMAVDLEKKALRFHLDDIQGGFEILGTRAYEPVFTGPGPQTLIGGDLQAGFYGETTPEELISYGTLSTLVGLSAGTLQHDAESAWLKFSLDGSPLYVMKKPGRHSVSWDQLHAAGLVFGTNTVEIDGLTYQVRLLRGAASDPTTDATGWDLPTSHGSEWNRLLYPIHSGVHTDTSNPTVHTDPTAAPFGAWAQYSDSDLVLRGTDNGRANWCQETTATSTQRVSRGSGVTSLSRSTSSGTASLFGWRAALVFVGD
jgi:hypothetical protein